MQVFINLIGNALKFTQEGTISVTVQPLGDQYLECSVSDTGIGIPAESLQKVFSRFEQFGRVSGSTEKSTGLGLSIVKGIIDLHGGDIRVEPNGSQGSRFVFTLPL